MIRFNVRIRWWSLGRKLGRARNRSTSSITSFKADVGHLIQSAANRRGGYRRRRTRRLGTTL